jgi:hypothetical protein
VDLPSEHLGEPPIASVLQLHQQRLVRKRFSRAQLVSSKAVLDIHTRRLEKGAAAPVACSESSRVKKRTRILVSTASMALL